MTVRLPDHLDLIAAVPAGIQKLRGLILELAVRGKLVAQDPNDEPASELLKRIAKERVRLEVAGICKKSKVTTPFGEDEQPFALPDGWEWARLDSIAPLPIADGDWIESKDQDVNGRVRLIQLADVGVGEFKDKSARFVNDETFSRLNCTEIVTGDILVARLPNPIGRACIFPGLKQKAITVVDVAIVRPMKGTCSDYFVLAINARPFREQVESYGKGATRFRVSTGHLKTIALPVPPLAEQHRIVAKVDELMALCDRLEAEQTVAGAAHARLVGTLLGTFTRSADAADLAANWQRLAEHFDTLLTTESSLDALKQTILQLAVMGKLVQQDPNDEPAHGKLGDFVDFLNGYAFKSEWFAKAGVRLLRNANVAHGYCDWKDAAHVAVNRENEFKKFALSLGDLVLSLDRPLINTGLKVATISEQDLPCLLLQRVARVSPRSESLMSEYLFMWFNSPAFTRTIDPGRSNGVPHISTKQVADIPFVLYSVEEQHRIVAKVDELMALCDHLKADLGESRARQARLATTLIETALKAA